MEDKDYNIRLTQDYEAYCSWHAHNIMPNETYPYTMKRERDDAVEVHEKEFYKLHKKTIRAYDSRWRTVRALMWKMGWFPQIEKRLRECNDKNKSDWEARAKSKAAHTKAETMPEEYKWS